VANHLLGQSKSKHSERTARLGGPFVAGLRRSVGATLFVVCTSVLAGPEASPVRLLQVDEQGPSAAVRHQRLVAKLDATLRRPYVLQVLATDIFSLEAIRQSLAQVEDRPDLIVLAGSGLMALAADERFKKAIVVFASQHDLSDVNLAGAIDFDHRARTGFTYDANVLPQILSILNRMKVRTRRVAIIADQYLEQAWLRRTEQMRKEFGGVAFSVFRVDSEEDLERCFRPSDNTWADVWIVLPTVMTLKRFEFIRDRLQAAHRVGIFATQAQVVAGAFMAYEPTFSDPYGIWARQIALLSSGVPARLIPVERPSEYRFAVNLEAARRIGVKIPPKVVKTATLVVSGGPAAK
jgi:hypothetical protein